MTRTRIIYRFAGHTRTGANAMAYLISNCKSYGVPIPLRPPKQPRWKHAIAMMTVIKSMDLAGPLGEIIIFREPRNSKRSLYKASLHTLFGRMPAAPPRAPRHREPVHAVAPKRRSSTVKILEQELVLQD